jgi:hypothetical protein
MLLSEALASDEPIAENQGVIADAGVEIEEFE